MLLIFVLGPHKLLGQHINGVAVFLMKWGLFESVEFEKNFVEIFFENFRKIKKNFQIFFLKFKKKFFYFNKKVLLLCHCCFSWGGVLHSCCKRGVPQSWQLVLMIGPICCFGWIHGYLRLWYLKKRENILKKNTKIKKRHEKNAWRRY